MYKSVFAYPILTGKVDAQRQYIRNRKNKASDTPYQKEMGWKEVKTWIQKLPKENLHILLVKSEEPIEPKQIHSRFCKRYKNGCSFAKEVHSVYLDTQGMDFCDLNAYPTLDSIPEFQGDFTKDDLGDKETQEFAFALPLLPGQADHLVAYKQSILDNPEKLNYLKAMRKKHGMIKMYSWIQRGFNRDFLVVYQEVIDPEVCRSVWRTAVANEQELKSHNEVYANATGLAISDLIPDLETL